MYNCLKVRIIVLSWLYNEPFYLQRRRVLINKVSHAALPCFYRSSKRTIQIKALWTAQCFLRFLHNCRFFHTLSLSGKIFGCMQSATLPLDATKSYTLDFKVASILTNSVRILIGVSNFNCKFSNLIWNASQSYVFHVKNKSADRNDLFWQSVTRFPPQ